MSAPAAAPVAPGGAPLSGGSADSLGDPARFGVLTVSDRASAGVYEDLSGPAILRFFSEAVASPWTAQYRVVADERADIEAALIDLVREGQGQGEEEGEGGEEAEGEAEAEAEAEGGGGGEGEGEGFVPEPSERVRWDVPLAPGEAGDEPAPQGSVAAWRGARCGMGAGEVGREECAES